MMSQTFLVTWKQALVVNASHGLFIIKEKYSVIVVYTSLFFTMPHWCIAYVYSCTNSSDMEVKKSWHPLPLQNKELLSKWCMKRQRTNTPVNEHLRICGDHFKAECFTKKPGSSCANLKPGSIPTKFCFVQEKELRNPTKDHKKRF